MRSPKKYTYEEVVALFKERGCQLLSSSYSGIRCKLDYIAKCGHRMTIQAYNFIKGGGNVCRKCNPNYNGCKKEIPIEKLRQEFAAKGCKLLSQQYDGVLARLEYIASCGHKNTIPYYCFHRGQGVKCPKCAGGVRKTIEDVRSFFLKEGCYLITNEYKWNRQKVEYIARCGHRHTIKASAFFEGEGRLCPRCQMELNAKKSIKYDKEWQRTLLAGNKCILVTPSRTSNEKMTYVAQCGHRVSMKICDFLAGYGRQCKKCYQKSVSRGEEAIKKYLDGLDIEFEVQYKIRTSPHWYQRIDFFIPSHNIAIEYNGRQHYEEIHFFHGHRPNHRSCSFSQSQKNDAKKAQWCRENGVELIVIDGRNWDRKMYFPKDRFSKYLDGLIGEKLKKAS